MCKMYLKRYQISAIGCGVEWRSYQLCSIELGDGSGDIR